MSHLKKWLCGDAFGSFRTVFVPMYFDAAFKCRPLGPLGCTHLSEATTRLREIFLARLVAGNEAVVQLQKGMILRGFNDVENGLKILLSPDTVWVTLFKEWFPKQTQAQFMTLVRTRGFDKRREDELEAEFNRATGTDK